MYKISVFRDEQELSTAASELIADLSRKSIEKKGRFVIALSGGKTPSTLYTLMANLPYSKELQWKNIFIFWSDERCVPADDEQNNSHLAKKMLLDHVPIPTENIFPVQVQMPAGKAAIQYEQMLKAFFKEDVPAFDLVLLGMGEDGHTASLFPNSPFLNQSTELVKAVSKPGDKIERITFTPVLINNAKHILILVTGKNKAAVLKEVLEKKSNKAYPVQLIGPKHGKLLWYVDAAAASKLKRLK